MTFENAFPLELLVTPDTIHNFTYSTVRNAIAFSSLRSPDFYGFPFDIYRSAIKCYQDLLVLSFIRDTLPHGSKILDVGGANSRVLTHLSNDYECWCIDKYEGLGHGDVVVPGADGGFRVVVDYMGNFNTDLPDNYFDLVFSISALEHGVQKKKDIQNILQDIDRVLKTGGFSLHCIDAVIDKTNCTGGKLVNSEFFQVALNTLPSWSEIVADKDLYVLPENIFNKWNMGRPYNEICVIDTCAFWVK
ncbi:MAG: class I SAM-dependent methyltransferase [Desulfocapsa sp.]|nr:class I SAM-dependent methyltransferase [Desulfocapsa sp.]